MKNGHGSGDGQKNGAGARLYVGNLPYTMTTDRLVEIFQEFGFPVRRPHIVTDRESGQSKGFGFVDMDTPNSADDAINALNGARVDGRTLRVDKAHEKS